MNKLLLVSLNTLMVVGSAVGVEAGNGKCEGWRSSDCKSHNFNLCYNGKVIGCDWIVFGAGVTAERYCANNLYSVCHGTCPCSDFDSESVCDSQYGCYWSECSNDNECGIKRVCRNHSCVDVECKYDNDCRTQREPWCVELSCVECRYNSDCSSSEYCSNNGECKNADCNSDNDCSWGRHCVNPRSSNAKCVTCRGNHDCSSDLICANRGKSNSRCVECTSDNHCGSDELCSSNNKCGTPKKIDTGVVWDTGNAYFFKGSQYIRFDIRNHRVDSGYPLSINNSTWPGWPAN